MNSPGYSGLTKSNNVSKRGSDLLLVVLGSDIRSFWRSRRRCSKLGNVVHYSIFSLLLDNLRTETPIFKSIVNFNVYKAILF